MTTLAVMQPYLFPYLGYFQLVHAVDRFVVLDDVTYIKGGWINRNRLCLDGDPRYFTVPLREASSNRRICDVEIAGGDWSRKMLMTFGQAYRRAPHYAEVMPLIEGVLADASGPIGDLAFASLEAVFRFLGLAPEMVRTTRLYGNDSLRGQDRILDICAREGATTYVNPPGGKGLYSGRDFAARGVELRFLRPLEHEYDQGGGPFQPWLSILDALMFVGRDGTLELLERYELEGCDDAVAGALPA
jgi:hypothetical protein